MTKTKLDNLRNVLMLLVGSQDTKWDKLTPEQRCLVCDALLDDKQGSQILDILKDAHTEILKPLGIIITS